MKQLTKLPFLFALIAITLSSCNLSRNVNSTASASYKKLQVAQQATVQKHDVAVATTTQVTTTTSAEQKATESIAANTPAPHATTEQPTIAPRRHQSFVKTRIAKAMAPAAMKIATRQGRFKAAHSTVKNSEVSVKSAVILTLVSLLLAIIFIVLAAASAVSGALGAALLLYILAYLCWIIFLVGLVLLIIALVNM
jgi:hypothetical protein